MGSLVQRLRHSEISSNNVGSSTLQKDSEAVRLYIG
nr:MAG TPA: hypothetical protein [Caudoviricetes sp.]